MRNSSPGPAAGPDVGGTSAVYRFPSVPPGRYRVVANYPNGRVAFREAEVVAGRVTPILLTRSRVAPIGFDLIVRWEKLPDSVRRARFYLTPLDGVGTTSVYEAVRGRAVRRRYGDSLRDGAYLLRYPVLGLARRIETASRTRWMVDFTPPKPDFLKRGYRTISVRVTRNGKPLRDLCVALKRQLRTRDAEEAWMRYGATTENGIRFEQLRPAGTNCHLIDRVLGVRHDVAPQIRRVSVWREDVSIEWKLGDRAR